MADIAQAMRYKIDVKNGLLKQPMTGELMRGDKNANRIIVQLVDEDNSVPLDGVTVTGKFFRGGDGIEIPLEGEANGNEATVLLDEHCYAVDGYFEASVKLTTGTQTRTILTITGNVVSDGEGGILDIENVVPSVADIVAQYQRMQEVTEQTKSATQAANTATANANTATGKANTAASAANAAATNANTAKDAANAAAGKIDNMTVSATPVSTGTATAELSTVDGHYHLALGLPKGDTGATPQISVQVQTGAAGSEASVSVSGTAEEPVIHLTIPRGETGRIENLTINGKTPDSAGNVALTASDVGALPSGGTAADSSKLGGKTLAEIMLMMYPVGAIYTSTVATSPASLFGGEWTQINGRFLIGTGAPELNDDGTSPGSYNFAAGSKGGEATHTLTSSEMPSHYHSSYLLGLSGSVVAPAYYAVLNQSAYTYNFGNTTSNTLDVATTKKTGDSAAHNNMPPYMAVYMWKRVS